MEVTGAAVVTEALPLFEDFFSGGVGKALKVGEVVHPVLKVGEHRLYLSLLKHELGNNGAVKAGLGTPGEGALGITIPLEEVVAEAVSWFW